MVFFKESSGGSRAVKIIESKEKFGPQGIELRDTIDPMSVTQDVAQPSSNNNTTATPINFGQIIALLISIAFIIFLIVFLVKNKPIIPQPTNSTVIINKSN